jgi:hypothetical protein
MQVNRKLNSIIKAFIIKSFAVMALIGMTDSALLAQTRIRFARGRSSATMTGSLAAGGERSYILRASAGQTMTVRVTSRNGDVSVDLGGNDVGTGDTVELRSTDEYIITVHNNGGATSYSLYVAVR